MLMLLVLSSCSTQKNTWATRSFHQTKVKYNIFYNGNIAFEEGLQSIGKASEDDYSTILNLYPVSDHKAAESSASQMDKTIEKCRKCIKLHSIKAKPKPDPKKRNDPKYKLWLQQEEFNNQMGNVWIRLGEAEFHKGDFLGSIGTFNYVARHYETDADIVARCGLWTARALGEMGWLYEAEDALRKVQVDALARKNAPLYSAVSADLLLKNKQYHEAIPYLKIAIPAEKRRVYRPRFQYVLAQLYEMEGNRSQAADAYSKVIRMTPSPDMEFNARMHRATLQGKGGIKALTKMTKLAKNKDKLDVLFGAIGDIYLSAGDTATALDNYGLAVEKSTQNGLEKGAILLKAGNLYYDRRDYVKAQPLYQEALTIISSMSEDYPMLERRSQTLDELIVEASAVQLQDSLQKLSRLPEKEQRTIIEKMIEDMIQAEKEAEEKAALAAREAEQSGLQGVDTRNMLGGGGQAAEWYFYNPQLIRSGKQEFSRRWGTRTLEDNWRRLSKTSSGTFVSSLDEEGGDMPLEGDSTLVGDSLRPAPITDPHMPEYYLQQIPSTPEELAASDSIIASALANMVYIYQSKLQDISMADETMNDLEKRFPGNSNLLDIYYMKYLDALKVGDDLSAEPYRQRILTDFPDSKQAYIVSQPDYFDRLRRMAGEQDSLFETTYNAYVKGDYSTVKTNKVYAEQAYPLSPLMPRFVFLNAVAVARTEGQTAFVGQLQDLVESYPESELSAMAKDFLAMMGQGMESQKGNESTSLSDMRAENIEEEKMEDTAVKTFSTERKGPSLVYLMLAASQNEEDLNNLLYQIALFNFSQFLIRDFDLQRIPVFENGSAIRVSGFDSLDESEWYVGLVEKNKELMNELERLKVKIIPITEENAALLNTLTLEQYESHLKKD